MINLDIPMFEHNIGSPHFTTSLNQEAYLDFPDSHKSVQQRLCDLDSSSFSFQILLIRGSFDAATLHLPTLLSPLPLALILSLQFLHLLPIFLRIQILPKYLSVISLTMYITTLVFVVNGLVLTCM